MIKLADTLAPMSNDFYAVESENVGIDIDGTSKSIQQAYKDGDLSSGGSSIQVNTMPIASVDELGKIYEFIGSTGTYVNGYFYECVSDGEPTPTYSWVQKNVQPNAESFTFNSDEFAVDSTTNEVSLKPSYADIPSFLPNNVSSSNKLATNSSITAITNLIPSDASASNKLVTEDKVNTNLGNLSSIKYATFRSSTNIDELLDIGKIGAYYQLFDSHSTGTKPAEARPSAIVKTELWNDNNDDRYAIQEYNEMDVDNRKFIRYRNESTWQPWQELATTDSTLKTIQLSGSVDCNTLTEPGLYTASTGAVSSITNTPANIGSAVQLDGGFSILVTKTNIYNVYYGMQMFIPYGSDVPFIRKSYYLNGQYWTSWKRLCATTVEDVPMTYINTFENETYVRPTATNVCSYCVTNGICTIKLETNCLSTTDDFVQILRGLPKPKDVLYSNAIDRTMSSNSGARGLFQLITDGTLRVVCNYGDSSVTGFRNLYATFSYLVRES